MESNLLTILGVQGLSRNSYTAAELKVMLRIIQLKQKFIKKSVIDYHLNHDTMVFSPQQIDAGYAVMEIKMSELGFGTKHQSQIRNLLEGMQRKPICVPFKTGDATSYKQFDRLFKCECYQKGKAKTWMVKFIFDNTLLRYFYSIAKGANEIDLGVVSQLRSAISIKFYLMMNCWVMKGGTKLRTENLFQMLFGNNDYRKAWSELERKTLRPAIDDLKRLYDHCIIDQYLSYSPFFLEESDAKRHKLPLSFTFHLHDRKALGDVGPDGKISEELRGEQSKLCLKLMHGYNVVEKVARDLSKRLSLSMIGELYDWFERKDYYLAQCQREKVRVNVPAFIVGGLAGFYRDRHA